MPKTDFRTPRVYVDAPLASGKEVALDRSQTNYLRNVLRLGEGDGVLLFNGRDGEWRAELGSAKKALTAMPSEQAREQPQPLDLHFLFAPLKHARLDYLVQKAVEMGASLLQPVITQHTFTSAETVLVWPRMRRLRTSWTTVSSGSSGID